MDAAGPGRVTGERRSPAGHAVATVSDSVPQGRTARSGPGRQLRSTACSKSQGCSTFPARNELLQALARFARAGPAGRIGWIAGHRGPRARATDPVPGYAEPGRPAKCLVLIPTRASAWPTRPEGLAQTQAPSQALVSFKFFS